MQFFNLLFPLKIANSIQTSLAQDSMLHIHYHLLVDVHIAHNLMGYKTDVTLCNFNGIL